MAARLLHQLVAPGVEERIGLHYESGGVLVADRGKDGVDFIFGAGRDYSQLDRLQMRGGLHVLDDAPAVCGLLGFTSKAVTGARPTNSVTSSSRFWHELRGQETDTGQIAAGPGDG